MRQSAFLGEVQALLEELSPQNHAYRILEEMSTSLGDLPEQLAVLCKGPTDANRLAREVNTIKERLATYNVKTLREVDLIEFIAELRDLRSRAKDFASALSHLTPALALDTSDRQFADFLKKFDTCIKTQEASDLFLMLNAAHSLHVSLRTIADTLRLVNAELAFVSIPQDFDTVAFVFDATSTFEEVIARLNALKAIVDALLELFKMVAPAPPEVILLDAGSFELKVALWKLASALLPPLFLQYFKNRTLPGQVEIGMSLVDYLAKSATLAKQLEENGIDTSMWQEKVQHVAVNHLSNIDRFLTGVQSFRHNNVEVSVVVEAMRRLDNRFQTRQAITYQPPDAIPPQQQSDNK